MFPFTKQVLDFTRYLYKFGVVGLIGALLDFLIFNFLSLAWRLDDGIFTGPLIAKSIAVLISTVFTWFGNRYWTFRSRRRKDYIKEAFEFAFVSLMGLVINLFVLWFSHYVLGFTSLLADNIAANVVGFGLATAFRFLLYKYWVYGAHRANGLNSKNHRALVASLALFEDEKYVEDAENIEDNN